MAEECVFVTVLMGVKVLVPSFDYDISVATTFESLLREVLSEAGVEVESLDDRNITVVINTEAKSGQSGRMIRKLGATVMSRLAGGRFITYRLAGAPQEKSPPSTEEKEAERAARAARSLSLLYSAGKALDSLPDKNDETKKLRSEHLWFNYLVDHFQGTGLLFPRAEVKKPDGSSYRFVYCLSQLLNHIDGHQHKFVESGCALPPWEVSQQTFRKVGAGTGHLLPQLVTDKIKSIVTSSTPSSSRSLWARRPPTSTKSVSDDGPQISTFSRADWCWRPSTWVICTGAFSSSTLR